MDAHRIGFVLLAFAAGAAGGCTFGQDALVDIDTQVRFEFGEIGTTCDGGGKAVDGDNVTTWTKTPVGDQCRVDFVWDGTLIAGLRDQVSAQVDVDKYHVAISGIDMEFGNIALRDAQGGDVTPPTVPAWAAHITASGQPVADFAGTDVSQLLAEPVTLTVPQPVIDAANQALHDGSPVVAHAEGSMQVTMDSLAGMNNTAIEARFTAHVQSHGEVTVP